MSPYFSLARASWVRLMPSDTLADRQAAARHYLAAVPVIEQIIGQSKTGGGMEA